MFLRLLQNSPGNRLGAFSFIKKETLAQVFSFEFCYIFKNIFLTEHLRAPASASAISTSYHISKLKNESYSFFQCKTWSVHWEWYWKMVLKNVQKRQISNLQVSWCFWENVILKAKSIWKFQSYSENIKKICPEKRLGGSLFTLPLFQRMVKGFLLIKYPNHYQDEYHNQAWDVRNHCKHKIP